MIRYLWAWSGGFLMLFYTAMGSVVVFVASLILPDLRRFGNWLIYFWASLCCRAVGLRISVTGLENVPREGCLFLFNHTSHLDIVIFHTAVRKPARFGGKAELFKIPLFGWALRRFGVLKINRGEREKVIRLYKDSVKRVKAGHSFVLAAEGTRIDRAGVGEKFKSGPFIFAISGQFPIVPVVIKGAYEVLPKSRFFPDPKYLGSQITVRVLPPVSTLNSTIDERLTLKRAVQASMTKAFAES